MFFFLFCYVKLGMLLGLEIGWSDSLPGVQQSQDSSGIHGAPRFALKAGTQGTHSKVSHSQSGKCPGRLKARPETSSVCL